MGADLDLARLTLTSCRLSTRTHEHTHTIVISRFGDYIIQLKEIYWWKHAAGCHKGSTIDGERDVHVEDEVARRVVEAFRTQSGVYRAQQQVGVGSSPRTKTDSSSASASPNASVNAVFAMTIVP